MDKGLILLLLGFLCYACGEQASQASTAAMAFDTTGFTMESIPGSNAQWAKKVDADGKLLEEGAVVNGQKEGTWTLYHPGTGYPSKIISFIDGKYNGPYWEMNERGQLNLRAAYRNNKLHGPWASYGFSRLEVEAEYKNGELHGLYREYNKSNGKLQKEANYKDGKQHGVYRFYNDKGEVTVEYEYDNGEKVSGGIVKPQETK
jgi:antitoxin component YwqK of YwqJK toxin-antitoxin module